MATKSISQLDTQATANETDLFEVAIVDANSASGYASKKESAAAIADAIVGSYQYPLRITGTTAKTIAGAINELKILINLLPKFAIAVVQTLPVSDISETTIYFVPAQDPEQGNYYEEYIYVNNAWELLGTTKVDLSQYYTSAQVDTLLAAKADSSSLATVATSGAYADLSGKPTIDTALDDTSTNAVENRAVASEINSIKSDISVEGSASGDIASFVDGSDNPLKELVISIEAVQSGSGDPSPTNVRPITGWTGANIYKSGINIWNGEWEAGRYDNNGEKINGNNSLRSKNKIAVKPSTTLRCVLIPYAPTTTIPYLYLFKYDKNGDFIEGGYWGGIGTPITIDSNTYFINFWIYMENWTPVAEDKVSLNYPATETAYHAYSGNTYNISWQSTAGTVYGGTLDVKSGKLMVDRAMVDLGSLNWASENTYLLGLARVSPNDATMALGAVYEQIPLCSKVKGVSPKSYSEFSFNEIAFSNGPKLPILRIRMQELAGLTDSQIKAALSGVQFVYEIATPVTYQLTPTEIRSLLGVNNVWADCGSVTELKYTRDLNLCINDIISRIEALEGGSSNRSLSLSPVLTKSLTSDSDTAEGKTEETEEETKEEAQKNER